MWGYGYGFFLVALKESASIRKEQIKEMALAARASQAEAKDWKAFLEL